MGLRSEVKQAGFCNGARSAVFLWYIPLYPTRHCCLFYPDSPLRLSNAIEIKGSLGVIGFCVGFFPDTRLRLLCNGNQRVVWFHEVSCQIFPPTTVHNMKLLCNWNQRVHFVLFHFIGLCVIGFCFFFPHYTYTNQDFLHNPYWNVVFLGCCVAFLQCPKNTMAKKKLVAKGKFGKKKPKSCHHVFSHQNVKSWTKRQRWTTKHKFLDPHHHHHHHHHHYYYHTILLLLFMLLRCNFQSRNLETPHP